jgi:hypothetical protein
MPVGWAIVVVVLCVAVVALSVVVLGLLRQITPVLEKASGALAGPDLSRMGPEKGSTLPSFSVPGADGEVTDQTLRGRDAVLLFLGAGCGPCELLVEEMRHSDLGQLASQLLIVTSPEGVTALGIPADLRVLAEPNREVSDPLSVFATPLAIAVAPDGVVRKTQVPNTMEQLNELAAVVA